MYQSSAFFFFLTTIICNVVSPVLNDMIADKEIKESKSGVEDL
jgi:hypothetical protein